MVQTLYAWQYDAIEAISETLSCSKLAIVSAAAGSGKTRTYIEIFANNALYNRMLVIVPTKVLMGQVNAEVRKWRPTYTVGYVGDGKDNVSCDITVCIVASVHKVLLDDNFDFVVVDEAHPVINNYLTGNAARNSRAQILMRICKPAKALLISAHFSARYNAHFSYEYTPDESIWDGVCPDFNITIPVLGTEPINNAIIRMICDSPKYKHVVIFFPKAAEVHDFVSLAVLHNITAAAITSRTSRSVRNQVFAGFARGIIRAIVSTEIGRCGVDLPIADTCIIADPLYPPVAISQCVGRIMRKRSYPGTVIIPSYDERDALSRFLNIYDGNMVSDIKRVHVYDQVVSCNTFNRSGIMISNNCVSEPLAEKIVPGESKTVDLRPDTNPRVITPQSQLDRTLMCKFANDFIDAFIREFPGKFPGIDSP